MVGQGLQENNLLTSKSSQWQAGRHPGPMAVRQTAAGFRLTAAAASDLLEPGPCGSGPQAHALSLFVFPVAQALVAALLFCPLVSRPSPKRNMASKRNITFYFLVALKIAP